MTEQDWCFLVVFACAVGLLVWNVRLTNQVADANKSRVESTRAMLASEDRWFEMRAELFLKDRELDQVAQKLERYKNLVANLNEDVNGEVKQTY